MNLFKKRKKIDELDYNLINEYAESGNKVNKLLQILIIIAIISLGLTLLQRLHILPIIGEFLSVISPVFIGILIAWLLVPLTDKLSKKMPRVLSCIIVYILVLGTGNTGAVHFRHTETIICFHIEHPFYFTALFVSMRFGADHQGFQGCFSRVDTFFLKYFGKTDSVAWDGV